MKIAMIVPVELSEEARGALKHQMDRAVSPGTEVTMFEVGDDSLSSIADIENLDPPATSLALAAAESGFDAIVMDGA